jgi:PAS domain S-box-containing protein
MNQFKPFQSKFSFVFSGLPEGTIVTDASQNIMAVNKAACKMLIYSKASLLSKNLQDLITSPGWTKGSKKWKEFIKHGSFEDHIWFSSGEDSKLRIIVKAQADFFPGFHLLLIKPEEPKSLLRPDKKPAGELHSVSPMLASIAEGVISTDIHGHITLLNPAAEKMTGWKSEEALGMPLGKVFKIVKGQTGRPIKSPVEKVLDRGTVISMSDNTVLVSRGGERYHISDSAAPIRNNKGKIEGVVLVFSDMSDKYSLKENIEESRRELSTLIGNLNGIAYKCRLDSQWTMDFISSGAYQLTGYLPDDLVANKKIAYADLIYPDDSDKVFKEITEAVLNKKRFQITYRIITKNKLLKWVWEQGIGIYDLHNNVIRLEGFITDISERVRYESDLYEREKNLENILNSITDGVIVLNQAGRIVRMNPVAQELTGWPKKEAAGKYFGDIFHCVNAVSKKPVHIPVSEVIQKLESFTPAGDILLISRDKKERNIQCRISPVLDAKRSMNGGIVVFSDVTGEFQIRQALKKRIVSLTMPLENKNIEFSELFDLEEIQRIQDSFSDATGVASVITTPDGVPITRPSNFCRLCIDIIRGTEKGRLNCYKSDAELGKPNPDGPTVCPCLSGGLFDAGASITIGNKHIANWMIGQVRDPGFNDENLVKYADEIGTDREEFMNALKEIPVMDKKQFQKIANTVFILAQELSTMAYQNVQQARLITDLNRTKQELREKEEDLSITLNSIGDGVISTDNFGNITRMNPIAEKLTGWPLNEALGRKLTEIFCIINADSRLYIPNPVDTVLEKGIIVGLANHTVLIARDGTERQISDSAAPIKNNDGVISGVILVFSDVTNQYAARKAIEDSEKALRESQKIAGLGSYVFDIRDGKWTCSDLLDDIFGIDAGFEKTVAGWISIIHPDWQKIMEEYLLNYVIKAGFTFDKEYKIVRVNDKAERWVHGRGKLIFNGNNIPLKMIGTIQDITERKNALNELRKLSLAVEYSPALVVITDKYGNIEYVNEKVFDMTGYTKEEVLGKNPRIWSSGYHNKHFFEEMWDTISSGKIFRSEILNRKKNGDLYWESVLISSLVDKDDNITHFVSVNEDITAKKEMIEELIVAKDRAEQSAKLKSEFLAQMSHEIRTPLNAIVGIVGYLKDLINDRLDADTSHWFESLDIATDRIIRTVELILRAAELQTSGYTTHPVKLNLDADILSKLYREFKSTADQKGLELQYNIYEKDTAVIADEYCLIQIFANLVGNAVKYTIKGRIEINIKRNEKGFLIVEIRDTGIGIGREFLNMIFEPFTQEEQGYSRSFEGNGLGLALVKKYCDLNNLTIEIESVKGSGSTFTVIFNN